MPPRIDPNERPAIVSYTLLPSQKDWLERRAAALSQKHGAHISASTIVRHLIDEYRHTVEIGALHALDKSTKEQDDVH